MARRGGSQAHPALVEEGGRVMAPWSPYSVHGAQPPRHEPYGHCAGNTGAQWAAAAAAAPHLRPTLVTWLDVGGIVAVVSVWTCTRTLTVASREEASRLAAGAIVAVVVAEALSLLKTCGETRVGAESDGSAGARVRRGTKR